MFCKKFLLLNRKWFFFFIVSDVKVFDIKVYFVVLLYLLIWLCMLDVVRILRFRIGFGEGGVIFGSKFYLR